jgi:anti-sigma B factor antagonist
MEVTEGRAGNTTTTLRIVGRVDSSVSKVLEQKVLDVVTRDDRIVLDLRDMNYVSSAGLRSFIILAKHARSRNQTIALAGMQEEITEIFEISGLLELFAVYDSVEAAVAAFPRQPS